MKRRCLIGLMALVAAMLSIAAPAHAATERQEIPLSCSDDPNFGGTLCYTLSMRSNVTTTPSGNRLYSGDATETWTITDANGAVILDRTYTYQYNYLSKDTATYHVYRAVQVYDDEFPLQDRICHSKDSLLMLDGEVLHDQVEMTCS